MDLGGRREGGEAYLLSMFLLSAHQDVDEADDMVDHILRFFVERRSESSKLPSSA